ncbi:MAG: antibiotic biosynthesis monooxygenase [Chloroflexi bacterium]|nr:antibiotic biosynthesis monooxygenase [Chloroflexota bacterium]
MYAQVTFIRVPMNKISDLREAIETHYLPNVRCRPGFLAAYLLEQIDDPDSAQLVQFWNSQADVENFHRTGLLEASIQGLAAYVPGLQIRRQGYMVRTAVRGAAVAEAVG